MPPNTVDDAIAAIDRFFATPDRKPRLHEWQRLAGHLNWVLNAIPWGRPALTAVYRKTSGKSHPNGSVYLNREVVSDLTWFRDLLPSAVGVRFVDQGRWDPEEADCTVWSNAALTGGACHLLHDLFPHFDTARKDALVQTTIRGSLKTHANPIHRKLPLRISHLESAQSHALHTSDYDDYLFLTVLSCAFFACHCIGELVAPNDRTLWDWRKLIRRQSYTSESIHRAGYHLPYHKGDPFYHGTDILFIRAAASPHINPVTILHEYVVCRDHIHSARTALFLRTDGSRPTRTWFEHHLYAFLPRSEYGGHSAHAGGATYYASLRLSKDVI
ncbi:hypothetical protein V8D89_006806 [Ganoderma adspersum]